jgi:regulator of protease activity HflC (stomatin/prohibitin superfamily)
MTVEYVVLGVILIIMGAVQTWLRHGPTGKALRAEQQALAERRAKAIAAAEAADDEADDDDATYSSDKANRAALSRQRAEAALKAERRSGKAWSGWTAIMGGVSMALGIALVVLGVLGR